SGSVPKHWSKTELPRQGGFFLIQRCMVLTRSFTPTFAAVLLAGTALVATQIVRADTIYVSNGGDNTIRRFSADGTGSVFVSGGLSFPDGLAFDAAGNLYIAN